MEEERGLTEKRARALTTCMRDQAPTGELAGELAGEDY